VIMSADQCRKSKRRDISSPGTSAAWTVAFSIIKGLVTDGGGGPLSPCDHGSEYGYPVLPVVSRALRRSRPARKIRVDGN